MAAQQLAVNVVDFAKARLPELEALDEELDKNKREAPRHLRRRARSHTAPFLAKKNPNNPNPTRRARRKPSELLKAHDPHAADVTLRFLETHVWHAKRFAMVDEGGWRRPEYRRDRLKAALRSLRTAAWCSTRRRNAWSRSLPGMGRRRQGSRSRAASCASRSEAAGRATSSPH